MAPRRKSFTAQAQEKRRPMEDHQQKARQKPRYDTSILDSKEEQSLYLSNFSKRTIWAGKDVDFVGLHNLGLTERFGKMKGLPLLTLCTPLYMTLVRLFY